MRIHAVLVSSLLFAGPGCVGVNEAAFAPAPVASARASLMWAAPGVQVVAGADQPLFVVDDAYWLWRDGAWMTWRTVGWQGASPPLSLAGLQRVPSATLDSPTRGHAAPAPARGLRGALPDHRW